MTEVYLGLGSNLGDRAANLAHACQLLAPTVQVRRCSRVYESEPVGLIAQPLYLNQVAAGGTELCPLDLLVFLKGIERAMGRRPSFKNSPRLIDLDLLFYGDWVFFGQGLTIPHPRIRQRSFVLAPLAEIAPELRHPATGETIGRMWESAAPRLARSWPYDEGAEGCRST